MAARGSRRRVLGTLLVGALGSLRLRPTVADDRGTAIADASGGNHNLATVAQEDGREQAHDHDNNHNDSNHNDNHQNNNHHDHDSDGDNNSGGDAECKAPGDACGVIKGDGADSSCCSGTCVERGQCAVRSGCGLNSCDLAAGYLCCYGAECDSAGNCISW